MATGTDLKKVQDGARERLGLDANAQRIGGVNDEVEFLCRDCGNPLVLDAEQRRGLAIFCKPGRSPWRCPKCREADDQRQQQAEKERRRAIREVAVQRIREDLPGALARCGVPVAWRGARLDHCPDLPSELVSQIEAWARSPWRWLYLHGPTGSGKTWLSVAALAGVLLDGLLPERACRFLRESDYLEGLRARMQAGIGLGPGGTDVRRARFLILDDLASAYLTDWGRAEMAKVVEDRHADSRPTIITSNLSLDELAGAIDDRVSSRISEAAEIIGFPPRDLRLGAR